MNRKPYKAKSLSGAQARVRQLDRLVAEIDRKWGKCIEERKLIAMLAAEGPAFDNPLVIIRAKEIRDRLLSEMGMAPDGKPLRLNSSVPPNG